MLQVGISRSLIPKSQLKLLSKSLLCAAAKWMAAPYFCHLV